jgi:peptide/nickel transport system substrate-binding protein
MFLGLNDKSEGQAQEPRGEIRVVESWRPDINVLGHNVLQGLFEYALDRMKMAPSLGVSWKWIDDTTIEIKLREGVRFHNGEPFDANAVKFNIDYQRQHTPHRYVHVFLKNLKEIRVVDSHTVQLLLSQPDSFLFQMLAYWRLGAPRYIEQVGWQEYLKRPIGTGPYMIEGEVTEYRKAKEGVVYTTLTSLITNMVRRVLFEDQG